MNLLEVKTKHYFFKKKFNTNCHLIAVTLDGAVIHQSGLMTGGQSSAQSTQKWHDSEIEGTTENKWKKKAISNIII